MSDELKWDRYKSVSEKEWDNFNKMMEKDKTKVWKQASFSNRMLLPIIILILFSTVVTGAKIWIPIMIIYVVYKLYKEYKAKEYLENSSIAHAAGLINIDNHSYNPYRDNEFCLKRAELINSSDPKVAERINSQLEEYSKLADKGTPGYIPTNPQGGIKTRADHEFVSGKIEVIPDMTVTEPTKPEPVTKEIEIGVYETLLNGDGYDKRIMCEDWIENPDIPNYKKATFFKMLWECQMQERKNKSWAFKNNEKYYNSYSAFNVDGAVECIRRRKDDMEVILETDLRYGAKFVKECKYGFIIGVDSISDGKVDKLAIQEAEFRNEILLKQYGLNRTNLRNCQQIGVLLPTRVTG